MDKTLLPSPHLLQRLLLLLDALVQQGNVGAQVLNGVLLLAQLLVLATHQGSNIGLLAHMRHQGLFRPQNVH